MEAPMKALLIPTDFRMRANILGGVRKIAIREGHRDYKYGDVVMIGCNNIPWAVLVDLVQVRHCTLRDVTANELEEDRFESHDDMLTSMQIYYPKLTFDSNVTVIRWYNVRGWLVDNRGVYLHDPNRLYATLDHGNA